jgi:hypothetical protein
MQRGPAGAGRAGGTLQAPSALYAPPPRANPDSGRTCESLAPLSKGFARGGGTGGAIVAVERGGEGAAPHGTQRRFSGEGQLHCSDHLPGSLCGLRVLKQARRATRCARRVHAAVSRPGVRVQGCAHLALTAAIIADINHLRTEYLSV